MTGLFLDLDGTLWKTKEAYKYSYQKILLLHPNISDSIGIDNTDILLGKTIEELEDILFYNEPDKNNLVLECATYVLEYLSNNELDLQPGALELIKNFDGLVFIVTKGIKELVDIYIKRLGLENYIKEYIAIGSLSMLNNISINAAINTLMENYQIEDGIYVSDDELDLEQVVSKKIKKIQSTMGYFPKSNKYKGIKTLFELMDSTPSVRVVKSFHYNGSEISLIENNNLKESKYMFGGVRLVNDDDLDVLLTELEEFLRTKKIKKVIGPIDGCSFFNYRFATDNFEEKFFPDCIGSKNILDILKKHLFEPKYNYISVKAPLDYKIKKLAEQAKNFYAVKELKDDFLKYAKEVFLLSERCFQNKPLYTKIKFETFLENYYLFTSQIKPDVFLVFDRKRLIAFSVAYKNKYQNNYVSKTVAIDQAYQNKRIILTIIKYAQRKLSEYNINDVIFHFQDDKNTLNGVWKNSYKLIKHYSVFERRLK